MAAPGHGRGSRQKTVGRTRKAHGGTAGGMIDVLAAFDTRYPDHRNNRSFKGNGPLPPNPFGKKMAKPKA